MLIITRSCDRCQKEISTGDYWSFKNLGINNPDGPLLPNGHVPGPKCYDLCPDCIEAFKYEFLGIEKPKTSRRRNSK